ncbi:MAG: glycosyltransferase family 1 protein [Chloroflexota bacterium]
MVAERLSLGDEWRVNPITAGADRAPVQRVALITEAFLPKVDGVSKLTTLTARHHLNMGREVLIYAPSLTVDDLRTPATLDGARVIAVPSMHPPLVPPESRFGFPYLKLGELWRFQPDLIHLFSPAALAWTGVHYARYHGVPLIANYQTDLPGYTHRYGIGNLEGLAWAYVRHLHNKATLTLVPTQHNLRELRERGFQRLRLWQRGADTACFSPAHRSAEMRRRLLGDRPASRLLVLYVGRLAREKRVDLLREVADLDGVALAIVGDGPLRSELERLFGDRATFTGYLTGADLSAAYASADVFGFTGTNEVAGQVVIEAMASGLPVLLPNSGGIVDYVTHEANGYVCAIDPADYARYVRILRDYPDRRRAMAAAARAYASRLSWEDTMTRLERLYIEALEIANSAPGIHSLLRRTVRSAGGALTTRFGRTE